MNISKNYKGHLDVRFSNRYSMELCLFWVKFRIHYKHMLGTEHCYTLQYQWLGRNVHKVYNWLFSRLSPTKFRAKSHIDKWLDECGMCHSCHEWTSPIAPCCGSAVEFEGGSEYWEDLLSEVCTCDMEGTCYACKYYEKVA